MTRHAPYAFATAVLLATGACSQPEDPAARATPAAMMPTPAPPVLVHVQVPEEAAPEAEAWAEAGTRKQNECVVSPATRPLGHTTQTFLPNPHPAHRPGSRPTPRTVRRAA